MTFSGAKGQNVYKKYLKTDTQFLVCSKIYFWAITYVETKIGRFYVKSIFRDFIVFSFLLVRWC
tara:strand:- start:6746 stop:6937 length:192 start_codon:yes stop_codon:yes gene_type:complete